MNNLATAIPVPEMSFFAAPGRLGCFADIQETLVPPVFYRDALLEAYGQTIPEDDTGGDLVDLIATGEDTVACVADVSGHGLRAALLMGMVKTAVRYGLQLGQSLAKLLDHVNTVLPAVKEPNMFATLAALRFNGSNEAEYISAGHVPLLHYRRRQHDVVRHSTPQFPLGLFEDVRYAARRIRYEQGDIFVLLTDGVVETSNEHDVEFGYDRLAMILTGLAERPLPEICEAVQAAVRRHGPQHDDRSILLVRAVGHAG